MIYSAKELFKNGETQYSIRNKISKGDLFCLEHGLYSSDPEPFIDEEYICKKYPQTILTGLSAFYIYGLTDVIPNKFHLVSEQHSFPIRRNDVAQSYQDSSFFSVGKKKMRYGESYIAIYDLERMLIELIRLREKYPPELYYEVINSFRKIKDKLDFYKINKYLEKFKNGESLQKKIKEAI